MGQVIKQELNNIDDYERFLSTTIEAWTPEQRVALAVAMAERWLPAYEAFSATEQWGDLASLRRSLEAVWNHLRGRTLTPADRARHIAQVQDVTPHMDDFDAYEALAACVILGEALECCGTADNVAPAVGAVLSGFEAVMPDWSLDPAAQPRLWQKVVIRQELQKQLKLLKQIGAITRFDDRTITVLRSGLTDPGSVGEVPPRRESTKDPTALTNQVAFEQYRRMLEADLKRGGQPPLDLGDSPNTFTMIVMGEWGGRYSRRRQTIDGSYGQLADGPAQRALVARQRAREAREKEVPDWRPEVRWMIDLCLQNPLADPVDVSSLEEPHGYGPSLRRLWAEAKRLGQSDQDAWNNIVAWARHRPPAWGVEDRRKKKGLAHTTPELGEHLARELAWTTTDDPDYPWAAEVAGERWRVRLNDFPDDFMYTLVIGDVGVGDFHDWPETWHRE
jgi:uncharacterized protein YjaG (DUF416 family)